MPARCPPGEGTVDHSNAPWRAFEAPDDAPATAQPPAASATKGNSMPRAAILAIVVAATLLVTAAALVAGGGQATTAVELEPSDGASPRATGLGVLIVDVAGAVVDPGVYRLPSDARVADAIAIAGGYGPRVDARRVAIELNLAAPLTDGQHLLVPSRDDPVTTGGGGGGAATGGGAGGGGTVGSLIDLNRSTAAELDSLPGIGPVTAAKIMSSRESAPFAKVEDLLSRKLVGQKTFDGLRELVTVR